MPDYPEVSNSQTESIEYLFSVDLEDVRAIVLKGHSFRDALADNAGIYLSFLKENNAQCTFFTVGQVLRVYPDLIRRIVDSGHEIACHTDSHVHLDKLGEDGFRRDMDAWMTSAHSLGIDSVKGFRAPAFSLTESTAWAFSVLKEYGFTYSSSVLPAKNPLYGWPGFGESPKNMDGVWEIPMNLEAIGPLRVPFGGGVYFRVLPRSIVYHLFRRSRAKGQTILGYFHPYDVDEGQERFMHPGINDSRFYNFLMYHGRNRVVPRLQKVMQMGFRIMRYDEYITRLFTDAKR